MRKSKEIKQTRNEDLCVGNMSPNDADYMLSMSKNFSSFPRHVLFSFHGKHMLK